MFLVKQTPQCFDETPIPPRFDLFRRVAHGQRCDWKALEYPKCGLHSRAKDVNAYLELHGTAYVAFDLPMETAKTATIFCRNSQTALACAVAEDRLFFLPARNPANDEDALKIAGNAVSAVLDYRHRVSQQVPEWLSEFQFAAEEPLRELRVKLQAQTTEIESKLAKYEHLKGLLCFRSDPLVELVCDVLQKRFGISAKTDGEKIEDVRIIDDEEQILAVGEIKGVNRNIRREDINQVDDHRSRRELPPTSPGVLIVNTFAGATNLREKDEAPHKNEVEKAAHDNVLMLRTLDLIRLARAVEEERAEAGDLQRMILTEKGWLCVKDDGSYEIRKE